MSFIKISKITLKLCLNVLLCNFVFTCELIWGASSFEALSVKDQLHFKNLYHFYHNKIHADSPGFYLTSKDSFNLSDEYRALLSELTQNPHKPFGHFNYPLKCVLPARVEFLKSLGHLQSLSLEDCHDLLTWKEGLGVKNLSVVYSSSYPNNPSSMFGHTLIRLKSEKRNELLDYSVAFSAWQDATDSGFLLAIKGLIGGYRGLVDLTKFYQKVNEYNYYESRDLIDYPVIMTAAERERFLNHLWEIYQTTYFDYYFADENCSSLLYRIFIVAFRDKYLPEEKRSFFLPRELVENLIEANLIDLEKVSSRSSLKKQFMGRFNLLSSEEKNIFHHIRSSVNLEENSLTLATAATLESLKDFYYYKKAREKGNLDTKPIDENQRLHDILVARSKKEDVHNLEKLDVKTENPVYPHLAHPPGELLLGMFSVQNKDSVLLGAELGFHDFTDSTKGDEAHQNFEILKATMRINDQEARLHNLTLVNLKSMHPWSFYDPQVSWGVEVLYDDSYLNRESHASFGGGVSRAIGSSLLAGILFFPTPRYFHRDSRLAYTFDGVSFVNWKGFSFFEREMNFHLEGRWAVAKSKLENKINEVSLQAEWSYFKNQSLSLKNSIRSKNSAEFLWTYRY